MKKAYSLITNHVPDNGIYGDCARACLASMLDIETQDVPHFYDGVDNDEQAEQAADQMNAWLKKHHGLVLIETAFSEDTMPSLDSILDWASQISYGVHYKLVGRSERANHCVVCKDDQIVHDPTYREPHGILGPASGGLWWLCFLVLAK